MIYPPLSTGSSILVIFRNLSLMEILVRYLVLFLFFSNTNRRLQVVLNGKSSQEYRTNDVLPQGSILGPTPFLLYINDLPHDVICDIAIYADNTTFYSKCDQASDL